MMLYSIPVTNNQIFIAQRIVIVQVIVMSQHSAMAGPVPSMKISFLN